MKKTNIFIVFCFHKHQNVVKIPKFLNESHVSPAWKDFWWHHYWCSAGSQSHSLACNANKGLSVLWEAFTYPSTPLSPNTPTITHISSTAVSIALQRQSSVPL